MKGRLEREMQVENRILTITLQDKSLKGFNTYLKIEKNSVSPTTRYVAITIIRDYLKFIGEWETFVWKNICNKDNVSSFIESKQKVKTKDNKMEKDASSSYIRTIYSTLADFFDYAEDREYISSNPMKRKPGDSNDPFKKPKLTDSPDRPYLKAEDFRKILDVAKKGCGSSRAHKMQSKMRERDLLILSMFMTCGMRESALVDINVEDINFNTGEIIFIDKGKKTHNRDVSNLMPLIEEWIKKREEILDGEKCDALFINGNKHRLTNVSSANIVKKYSKAALGYEISPHDLRAGVITILVDSGKSIAWVSKFIDHSNVATTSRYFKTNKKEKKEGADMMSKSIGII